MFGITGSGSYNINFNFGNIDYLTYGLYFGDILLLIMILFVVLSFLGLGGNFKTDLNNAKATERREKLLSGLKK